MFKGQHHEAQEAEFSGEEGGEGAVVECMLFHFLRASSMLVALHACEKGEKSSWIVSSRSRNWLIGIFALGTPSYVLYTWRGT